MRRTVSMNLYYQASHDVATFRLAYMNPADYINFSPLCRCVPMRAMASSFLRFLDHTQRRITDGRTPLDE